MASMNSQPPVERPRVSAVSRVELERRFYNATVIEIERLHDELAIFRVRPDRPFAAFQPGQYTVLGLGYWEPRVPRAQAEMLTEDQLTQIVRRAYSVSCPMLDARGHLVRVNDLDYLEFYITLVLQAAPHRPPALTPRLFALSPGSRLYLGEKFKGHYTLEHIAPDCNVIFVATGTGEAPHNTMVAELLHAGHRGRIASITCTRHAADLGYLATQRQLEQRYDNYRYLPLTTREPENLDPQYPGYVGKRYVQTLFASGEIRTLLGYDPRPSNCHVFLCGNPAMIGAPLATGTGQRGESQSQGMIEVLQAAGFQSDAPHRPGNIHFETYW